MATKLQCEICGGKLVGKPGGIFECENCGTEYSTAWAKEKIQEITGKVQVEGTVEVKGKVQVEGPVKIEGGPSAENLTKRGFQMLEYSDYANAESCFSRALELDPESGDAFWGMYLCKRKENFQDALQSIRADPKIEDDTGYFDNAEKYATGKTKEEIDLLLDEWYKGDKSYLLPKNLRHSFSLREGVLHSYGLGFLIGEPELKAVVIPGIVERIEEKAFCNCDSLESVELCDGIIEVGKEAFSFCENLKSVTIPGSVRTIAEEAFYHCESLESVELCEGITEIGKEAFGYCESLKHMTIPGSVRTIADETFSGCSALESVELSDGITEISKEAFSYCEDLKHMTIPGSVRTIADEAFSGYGALESIELGDGITEIGKEAFSYCESLKHITIPGSVRTIAERAFHNCESLESVELCEGITEIGKEAFSDIKSGSSMEIYSSTAVIAKDAFDYDAIIRGYAGSTAERYAADNDLEFIRIQTDSEIATERRRAETEETMRIRAVEEAKLKAEEEEHLRQEEAERRRQEAEEAERRHQEEAERKRQEAEEAERRRQEDSERRRREKIEKENQQIATIKQDKRAAEVELANLKGLFTGRRRKELEAEIAKAEEQLAQLTSQLTKLQ